MGLDVAVRELSRDEELAEMMWELNDMKERNIVARAEDRVRSARSGDMAGLSRAITARCAELLDAAGISADPGAARVALAHSMGLAHVA